LSALGLEATGRERATAAAACPSGFSDERLMAAVVARAEERAFEELAARHREKALRVALALLGRREAAEDALQESFLHLVRARRSFRRGMRFAPWFYALVRNACRDELRRRAVRLRDPAARSEPPAQTDPCDDLVREEDCRAAGRAFAQLPDDDRELLALRIHGGLEFGEIARVLGLAEDAAKKRAYRALDRLRRQLSRTS
jgi:RNA polymerase sigma-70 factor (ECF subfamily)